MTQLGRYMYGTVNEVRVVPILFNCGFGQGSTYTIASEGPVIGPRARPIAIAEAIETSGSTEK
jgi:hypothetical protein